MRDHVGAAEMHLLVERAQLVVLALGRLSVGFSSCVLLSLVLMYWGGEGLLEGLLEGCLRWGQSRVCGCVV